MDLHQDVDIARGNISGGLNVTDLNKIVLKFVEHLHVKTER